MQLQKHQLLKHVKRWPYAALFTLDGLFFGLTEPRTVAVPMLMIGFGLIVANLYCMIRGVIRLARWYGVSFGSHARRVAAVATGVIGSVVALQSIGQLSPRDVIVLLPFAILAYLYTSYSQTSPEP
ncbi:MAG: hypothetical protein JWO35_546 [Candidatus Saccharibacteria bacterium]|nr:hypothetical protein [Candidatus Saccharibacteria bacterium]